MTCAHSPFGATISDVWFEHEQAFDTDALSLGDWSVLLAAVQTALGDDGYRTFLIGLAWEVGIPTRGLTGGGSIGKLPQVYPIIHPMFDTGGDGGIVDSDGAVVVVLGPTEQLKVFVRFEFAMAETERASIDDGSGAEVSTEAIPTTDCFPGGSF